MHAHDVCNNDFDEGRLMAWGIERSQWEKFVFQSKPNKNLRNVVIYTVCFNIDLFLL